MSQLLGNAGPRITNAMGNMVGGVNLGRNISSGGLSMPGLSSRLNMAANSGSGLNVQGQNRMLGGGLPQGIHFFPFRSLGFFCFKSRYLSLFILFYGTMEVTLIL